ncbi:hypothetical protein FRB99_007518 [Tulasnella sp. 403]|nr:hypothetical protein FRB99_007518 [Tulasnella sp. 403]
MSSQQPERSHSSPGSISEPGSDETRMHWGKWHSNGQQPRRHYSLEVVQHPIRARMCGFGDKDRRPLAPAAIAKMVVRNDQFQVLDVDDVEIDFFLVTCDLWSADGHTEVNLVRNPSAVSRRRNRDQAQDRSGDESDWRTGNLSSPRRLRQDDMRVRSGQPNVGEPLSGQWSPSQPQFYSPPQQGWNHPGTFEVSPRVGGSQDVAYTSQVSPHAASGPQGWSPNIPGQPEVQHNPAYDPRTAGPSYPPGQQPQVMQVPSSSRERDPQTTGVYTRTLVGPLTANAARLTDDKKQFGIFFTFQDLSVRTEGVFRLRLRLLNVGAPPAPNRGTTKISEGISPVLAGTFTNPFTVYSAKKFPGVPPMTALSLEFGKQGQKLPLRNRPGAGRGKGKSGDSDDDMSGAESEEAV